MANTSDTGERHPPVKRVLAVFSNAADEVVTEHPLPNFDLEKFKKWFRVGEEDSFMYSSYEINLNDVEFISIHLAGQIGFDFDGYSYFVEAYASSAG